MSHNDSLTCSNQSHIIEPITTLNENNNSRKLIATQNLLHFGMEFSLGLHCAITEIGDQCISKWIEFFRQTTMCKNK